MPSDEVNAMRAELDIQYEAYRHFCPVGSDAPDACGNGHHEFAKPHTWRQHIERYHPKTWQDLLTKIRRAGGQDG